MLRFQALAEEQNEREREDVATKDSWRLVRAGWVCVYKQKYKERQ